MSGDFCDTRNSMTFNTSDDSNGNTFPMPGIDNLKATAGSSIDFENSLRMDTTSNKPIITVARRNERERKRVRLVNQGFAILRERVPRDRCSRGRRSSKVETLRAAIMYIRQLQQLLLESQMRFQTQDMAECYTYSGDHSFLNSPVTSVYDNYSFSNEYTQNVIQTPPYPLLKGNVNLQSTSDTYDRHLAVPWFA